MNPIFKKLHLPKNGPALVLNAPDEFLETLTETNVEIHEEVLDYYHYVQVFAQDEEDANDLIAEGISALETGGYFWFSYPKAKSEIYQTELDEESVAKILESFDMEAVTQVSLNNDWTAIRIRFSDELDDDFSVGDKGGKRIHNLYD